jgi:glc operon protein GlcG
MAGRGAGWGRGRDVREGRGVLAGAVIAAVLALPLCAATAGAQAPAGQPPAATPAPSEAPAQPQAQAPTQGPLPYGLSITLEQARRAGAAAEAEARRQNWNVVIAIVDAGGHLVWLERRDQTQLGSLEVARRKAWTAVMFRRSTKQFEETLAGGGGGLRVLAVDGVLPIEGGLPLVVDGRIVGAIGVSGVQPQQDGQVAQAGVDAVK